MEVVSGGGEGWGLAVGCGVATAECVESLKLESRLTCLWRMRRSILALSRHIGRILRQRRHTLIRLILRIPINLRTLLLELRNRRTVPIVTILIEPFLL